jgi:isopentenyldiphosphate isomerase
VKDEFKEREEEVIQRTALDHLFFSSGWANTSSHPSMKMPSEKQEKSGKGQEIRLIAAGKAALALDCPTKEVVQPQMARCL